MEGQELSMEDTITLRVELLHLATRATLNSEDAVFVARRLEDYVMGR